MSHILRRRNFVKIGLGGILGTLFGRGIAANEDEIKAEKNMILLWLGGGPATIDMWDMKPQASEEIRGEFSPIATSVPGLQICEHLPNLARVMDRCTLIRSLHHSIPAHGPGAVYMLTGNKPSSAVEYPAIGSIASKMLEAQPGVPAYVSFGNPVVGSGYVGSQFNPFEITFDGRSRDAELDGTTLPEGLTRNDLSRRSKLRSVFESRFQGSDSYSRGLEQAKRESISLLHSDKVKKAFQIDKEPESLQEQYGRSDVGRNALIARRLLDFGTRFVTISMNGWDTHAQNFNTLQNQLLPNLDRALATLISDLDQQGLLANTIVCCMGEFGRTPKVNGAAGRDHWSRSMCALLAGGGCKAGFIYGATDKNGREPIDSRCTPTDLMMTLVSMLGISPYQRLESSSGRPMTLFKNGSMIDQIIS